MEADGAGLRRFGPFVNVSADTALPTDRLRPLKDLTLLNPLNQLLVPILVMNLNLGDPFKNGRNLGGSLPREPSQRKQDKDPSTPHSHTAAAALRFASVSPIP